MTTRIILVAASILLSALALSPVAAAQDDVCSSIPDRTAQNECYKASKTLNNPACDGGDKGYAQCGAGQCPAESGRPATGERTGGCTAFVCGEPDWNAITPEGGDDCLDMLCRNIPPTIGFVQITLAPIVTLLGGTIPGATIVRAIVLNAGFYCERGTGTGGPGNPCQHVLSTPAGRVGADPESWLTTSSEKGQECSWAQSGVTGYNYVYTNAGEYVLTNPDCGANLYVVAVVGGYSENYRFTDSCSP